MNPLIHTKNQSRLYLTALLLLMIPYLLLCFYIHPAADDFGIAERFHRLPFWEMYWRYYNKITGRYFSILLLMLNPISFDSFSVYKMVPAVFLFALLATAYVFFKTILKDIFTTLQTTILSLCMILLWLSGMPLISEGLYWYSAIAIYSFGLLFAVWAAIFAIKYFQESNGTRKKIFFVFTLLSLLTASGCNEIQTLFLGILLFYFLLVSVRRKEPEHLIYAIFLLVVMIGFIWIAVANSNDRRMTRYDHVMEIRHSVFMSVLQTIRFLGIWLTQLSLWLTTLIFLPAMNRWLRVARVPLWHLNPKVPFVLILIFAFLSAFLPYMATGMLGQHRTYNLCYFYFLFLWLWFVASLVNSHSQESVFQKAMNFSGKPILFILVGLSFLFSRNGFQACGDLISGKAQRFDIEMEQRYELLRTCSALREMECEVPLIYSRPGSIFCYDLVSQHNHWLNKSYGVYFSNYKMKVVSK